MLMVAPILYLGQRQRDVYLPTGCSWKNAYSGEVFNGGKVIKVEAPIDVIPVFLQDGTDMPVFENDDHVKISSQC